MEFVWIFLLSFNAVYTSLYNLSYVYFVDLNFRYTVRKHLSSIFDIFVRRKIRYNFPSSFRRMEKVFARDILFSNLKVFISGFVFNIKHTFSLGLKLSKILLHRVILN